MKKQVFESTAAGKKNGVMDTLKANPLVFAIFVFPTVMMGVALIIRPDFRAQILGSGGSDDDKKKMRSNASINIPKNAPAPLYEEIRIAVDATDNKEDVVKDAEDEGISQQNSSTISDNLQQSDSILAENTNQSEGGKVKDLISALGIRPHPSL